MNILVINSGSSSIKFTVFQSQALVVSAFGTLERIGTPETTVKYQNHHGHQQKKEIRITNTQEGVKVIADLILDPKYGVIQSVQEITAVGHRVVHGGESIRQPVIVDTHVKKIIKDCFQLAPLHNPPNLKGIEACETIFTDAVQIAVFDTAFHSSLPEQAYLYAIPYKLYQEDQIRRYGFHGTSHQYVSEKAAELMEKPLTSLKMVTCHLGNGSSITAVDNGKSVDTSMGMTPLEGAVMGTRCGDIDAAIIFYLMNTKNWDADRVNTMLNQESGLLGLSNTGSGDLRDIEAAEQKGHPQAKAAIDVCAYRIKKYIGAYTFAMGGLDALVFTAGIGENSPLLRKSICQGLENQGLILDEHLNSTTIGACHHIHHPESQIAVWVVPTDEEKAIAMKTISLLS